MVIGRIFTVVIGVVIIGVALLLNSIKTLNLMDIMVRYFAAFGPPLAIPIVTGLLFKKINSRGVAWGVIGGILVGVTLQVANILVVQKYGPLMSADARVDYWLRSGWTSFASLATIVMVFLLMWLGTKAKETSSDEKERVEQFFWDLRKPYDLDTEHVHVLFPFSIMSIILAVLGGAMVLISLIMALGYHDFRAFRIDLTVGVILATVALIMRGKLSKYSL